MQYIITSILTDTRTTYVEFITNQIAISESESAAKERTNCLNGCGTTSLGGNGMDFVHPATRN